MKKYSLFWLMLVGLLISGIFTSQSMAAVFHVTNATEFQNALNTAESNGEDDTIYLAAGTYQGSFGYQPPETEHKSLTIAGEPDTWPASVILDGQNLGTVLFLQDYSEAGVLASINIHGVTIQNGSYGIDATMYKYDVSITDCILWNNSGLYTGGGLSIQSRQGNVKLENNLIMANSVSENYGQSYGGGGYMRTNNNCILVNNIVTRNSAEGTTDPQGGGLYLGCSAILIGNTIYGNQANKGGGVYFGWGDTASVYNNIIYGNSATQGEDIYFESVTNTIGHNNNYFDMFGSWTDSGANLNTDPLFVSIQNNDFHLQPTSPMINAGTTTVPDPPGLPATDFEGNPRVMGPAPDIGAYESFPVNPSQGTIGTEIAVTGSGYGSGKGKVLVGTVPLKILEWTDTRIRGLLSKAPSFGPDTYDVTIRPPKATAIVLPDSFTVRAPEIDYVDPTSGLAGDTIAISGYLFGTKKGKVTLGGKSCKVTSWTMGGPYGFSQIIFVVPKGLTSGTKELKVTNDVGAGTTNFTVD